jgi:hypothetical protein
MGFGKHLGHEELDPAAVVGQPVVPVALLPAFVAVARLVKVRRYRPRQRRPNGDYSGRPVRVPGSQLQGMPPAQRQPDEDRPLGAGGVQHSDCVVDVLSVEVGGRVGGPVRPSVAPALDRDHPEVSRQVGHLRLPLPGMDDGPRGEQGDRRARLFRAVHLVADRDPTPFNRAHLIWKPCAHGLSPTRLGLWSRTTIRDAKRTSGYMMDPQTCGSGSNKPIGLIVWVTRTASWAGDLWGSKSWPGRVTCRDR